MDASVSASASSSATSGAQIGAVTFGGVSFGSNAQSSTNWTLIIGLALAAAAVAAWWVWGKKK